MTLISWRTKKSYKTETRAQRKDEGKEMSSSNLFENPWFVFIYIYRYLYWDIKLLKPNHMADSKQF